MKNVQAVRNETAGFGLLQAGILLLTLFTGIVHLIILNVSLGHIDPAFTLNGLAYLALLVAYFLPQLRSRRNLVRMALMVLAALTIVGWLVLGDHSWPAGALGYFTKLDEIVLILLLLVDRRN
ncbi:MAG TPA: hypothetical protein VF823_11615 [Anaerolineales bacterium]